MSRYVNIENARIIFRNFSGKEGKYNRAGERSFAVILDGDVSGLVDEGWNIKYLKPREEDEQPIPYISVSVRYDFAPPKIYAVTDGRPVLLDEEAVGELDYADISQMGSKRQIGRESVPENLVCQHRERPVCC